MDDMNYEAVHRLAPSRAHAEKIERMRDYCPRSGRSYVPDPYRRGARGLRAGARHVGGGVCQPARRDQKSKPKLTLHVLRRKVSRAAKR